MKDKFVKIYSNTVALKKEHHNSRHFLTLPNRLIHTLFGIDTVLKALFICRYFEHQKTSPVHRHFSAIHR